MPEVSIIMPIYNGEKHLDQCFSSILAQTFADWELIAVDDGSTDSSGEISDRYGRQDPRVKVIHQPNGGLVAAVKTGAEAASAPYLMFVDMDDWYQPDQVARMHELIVSSDADCVNGTYTKYLPDGTTSVPVPLEERVYEKQDIEEKILYPFFEINADIYRYWSAPRWDKIYRTELVREVCSERSAGLLYGEDLDFCLRYLAKCRRVMTYPVRGYCYRVQESSMAHGYTEKMLVSYEKMLEAIRRVAEEQNRPFAAAPAFEDLGYLNMLFELDHEPMEASERRKIRRMLKDKLHNKHIFKKMLLKKDFPGKDLLQKIYRKIRG